MKQIARNLTDAIDGFLRTTRFLIHDRDSLFSASFRATLSPAGMETVKLPARSPNLNAHAERFVRSIKHACLNRIVPLGENHLRTAVRAYVAHYLLRVVDFVGDLRTRLHMELRNLRRGLPGAGRRHVARLSGV